MLSDDVRYLVVVFLILVLVNLQIKRIVEQIDLLLTYLCYDTQRGMFLLDQHVDDFVGDFG